MSETAMSGGCACGAVRFETHGAPSAIAYCHCDDCRARTGAPVVVWVSFAASQVRFSGTERRRHESSPGIFWGFCGACGGRLSWEGNPKKFGGPDGDLVELLIGCFDEPAALAPDSHWFDSERLPWFDVADALPRYARIPRGDDKPTHAGPKT